MEPLNGRRWWISWWAFGLVLATVGGSLVTACSDNEPDGPRVITFLRHDNPNYRIADEEFFAAYTAAHPGVVIDDATVDFRTLASELTGDLRNNQFRYDFVLIPPSRMCGFTDNLHDVPSDIITLDGAKEAFFQAALENVTCGGKLKGLPVEYNLEYGGVVVNLDKYEAKFGPKTPEWADWATFIAEAAMLAEFEEGTGKPMANGLDIDPGWSPPTRHIFFAGILQRGGQYWSAAGDGSFNFSTPEAQASLQAMVDWIKNAKIMSTTLIPGMNTGVTTRLAAGATGFGWSDPSKPLSVMGYVGTWGVPSVIGQVPAGQQRRYGFYALPPVVGTEHKFVTDGGWAFAVPKTSRHPALAWDIARSLALHPPSMRRWLKVTGALPALKEAASPADVAERPELGRVRHLLELGRWRGYVPVLAYDVVNGSVVSNFFAAVRDMKDVPTALADMQKTANDEIAKHR